VNMQICNMVTPDFEPNQIRAPGGIHCSQK
jgi:hypothetical protein